MTEQKQCAYCHAKLFEDDDVVYCPECGAAHHRDCYNALGRCAKEQLHGTEQAQSSPADDGSSLDPRPDGIPSDRQGRICAKCGNISSSDTLFCPYCSTPFNQHSAQDRRVQPTPPPFVAQADNPYGSADAAGEIEGVPASEMAIHVRTNSARYLSVFDRLSKGKKSAGFNWSGFIFSYAWLFYRKCYFAGLVSILFTVIGYILTVPYCVTMLSVIEENGLEYATQLTNEQYNLIGTEMAARLEPFDWLMLAAAAAVIFLIHLAIGIFGDRIYLNTAKSKIRKIKANEQIDDKITAITASGGVNIISAALIFYIMINFVFGNVIIMFY